MQELLEKFFRGLSIQYSSLTLHIEGDDFYVKIETTDSPLLIGMHGKNIEIFGHLLSRMLEKMHGQFIRLHLEVNDYIQMKEERLFRLIDSRIASLMSHGGSMKIANLSSYERKKAHNYIAELKNADLTTKSEGEGTERILILTYTGEIKAPSLHIENPKKITPTHLGDDLSEDGVGI